MIPTRIAIVAPHFSEYSERLAAGLSRLAPTMLVLNAADRALHRGRPIASNATVRELAMDRKVEQARAFLAILAELARFRPRLVVFQEGVRPILKGLMLALAPFCRIALIVHDPEPHSGSDSRAADRHVPFRRWLRRKADVLIVHGESCARAMASLGYEASRIVVIDHGVLQTPDPASAPPPPEPGRILMFGRMEAYKGLEVLLDAAERLHRDGVAYHLVVAGRGPEQSRLRDRMKQMPNVEPIDRYLSSDELGEQIARADFVVAPYLDATQSGVLASAMANGRPVIATRVGGLGDVILSGQNGLLVPAGDAKELAAAMAQLLNDRDMTERLAEGVRNFVRDRLDWDRIAERLLDGVARRP